MGFCFSRFSFGVRRRRIFFVANYFSVSIYGVGLGYSESLPIGLDANILNIGVFYFPYPPFFSPTVIPEAGSVAVVVTDIIASDYHATPPPPPED